MKCQQANLIGCAQWSHQAFHAHQIADHLIGSGEPPMVGSRGRVELMQFPLRPSPRESTEAMVRNIPIDWHLAGPPADQ